MYFFDLDILYCFYDAPCSFWCKVKQHILKLEIAFKWGYKSFIAIRDDSLLWGCDKRKFSYIKNALCNAKSSFFEKIKRGMQSNNMTCDSEYNTTVTSAARTHRSKRPWKNGLSNTSDSNLLRYHPTFVKEYTFFL